MEHAPCRPGPGPAAGACLVLAAAGSAPVVLLPSAAGLAIQGLLFGELIMHAAARARRARYLAEEGPIRERERQAALRHVERPREQGFKP